MVNTLSLQQLKKQIKELKNSAITKYELQFKIFEFRVNDLTNAGETEEDVDTYIVAHPHTHVMKFFRKSFRKI